MEIAPAVLAALIVSSLVALGAVVTAVPEIMDMFDPCHSYGQGASGSEAIGPDDACQSRSGTSETRAGTVIRLLLVQGVGLIATALAFVAVRDRRWFIASGVLFGALVVPLILGGTWILVLVASVLCFMAASKHWPSRLAPA